MLRAAFLAIGLLSSSLWAITVDEYTFIGTSFAAWEDSSNWSPSGPPVSTSTAIFNSSTALASISAATEQITVLNMSDGGIGGNGTLEASGLSMISGGKISDGLSATFGTNGDTTTGLKWSDGTIGSTGNITAYGDLDWSGGILDLTNGSSIYGTFISRATAGGIKGAVEWANGHIDTGAGISVQSTGILDISGDSYRELYGAGLSVDGLVNFTGISNLYLYGSGQQLTVNSGGTIDFQNDATIDYGVSTPPIVNLYGAITKTGGTGESYISANIQSNAGEISVYSGSLALNEGGYFSNGSSLYSGINPVIVEEYTATSNPELNFNNGSFTLSSDSSISTNQGDIIIGEGGSLYVYGSYDVSGGRTEVTTGAYLYGDVATTLYTDKLDFINGQIAPEGHLVIRSDGNWSGGTLGVDEPIVGSVGVYGSITPALTTYGDTTIQNTVTFNIDGNSYKKLQYHTLYNNGTVFQSDSIDVVSSAIVNNGLWSFTAADAYVGTSTPADGSSFTNNSNLFYATDGVGGIETYFYNNGNLQVTNGELVLSYGGVFSNMSSTTLGTPVIVPPVAGEITPADFTASPKLTLTGGTYDFQGNVSQYATITGTSDSAIEVNNAYVTVTGLLQTAGSLILTDGADVDLGLVPTFDVHKIGYLSMYSSSVIVPVETSSAPILSGLGGLYVENGDWQSGTISGSLANGPIRIGDSSYTDYPTSYFSIYGSDQKMLQTRNLENYANTYLSEGDLLLDDGHIMNYAYFGMYPDASMSVTANGGSFENYGQFSVYYYTATAEDPYSAGETIVGADFTNYGDVYLDGNTRFSGAFKQTEVADTAVDTTSSNAFGIFNDATVTFEQGATFESGELYGQGTIVGDIIGTGVEIEPVNNTYASTAITPATIGMGGALTFDGNVTLDSTSTVFSKIFGSTTGEYDQIFTTGTFTLNDATLFVSGPSELAGMLTSSDYFPILSASGTGQFIGIFAGLNDGDILEVYDFNGYLIGQFNIFYNSMEIALTNFEAVPEPETWALLLLGLAAVGWSLRRRRS